MDSLENDNSLIPVPTLNLEQAKKEGWDDSSLMPTPTAKQEIVEADHKEEVKRSVDEIMLGIKPQKILPGIPTTDNTPTPGVETNNSGGFLDNLGKAIQSASESTIGAGNPVALLGSDQDPLVESIRSMPLYRTIMLTDEQKLADAQKIGSAVGINPMSLAVNQWMYDDAKYIYDQQKNMEMLQGRPFSASAIHELYPEVDLSDPVAAAMALKDTRSLLASRQTIQDIDNSWIMNGIKNNIAFIANSWNEGQRMDEVTEIQYAAMQGKITDEEAARKISVLIPDEEENVGTVGTVVKETLKQVSMQKNQILRAASDIVGVLGPQAPQLFRAMAITAPGAGLAAGAAAGVSGAGLAVGGAIAGIGLGTAAIFLGSYRAQAGSNYWQYRQRRNANGTPLYTQEQAKDMAKRDAIVQAAIETSLLRYAYAPISKVFGKNAATAIIENTATRNKLLTAGVRAYKGIAAKQAARQAVRGTLSEVAEEGAQDLVSSIDERFMGNNQMTMSAMMNSAVDAMLDALPAAIGMTVPGAALRGVGSLHAMKRVDRAMLGDAKEEYRRENEKSMVQRLLEIGSSSKLKSTSPEAYAKTIQNQLQRQGMGTLYVDASQAVETEQGQAALNQLIEDKVVTAKEVSEAVENGTQLEISPGTYFQTATPEIAETISEYSTFDKAGRTLADIKAARQNLQKVVDTLNQTHEEREATAIQGILDKDFSDPKERAVMEEILPGNLEDIPKAIRAKTDEVKTQLADLTGAQSKIDYIKNKRKTGKTSDVGVIDVIGESGQYESKRVSGNEGWYSAWYKDNKKAPSIRDAYDIAYKETMAEIKYSDDPDAKAAGEEITALMEKLETLEDLAPKVEAMDTREIMARTMLSDEAFNAVYLPAMKELQKGNSAVREARRDSALILAKTAEAFHESYGTPYEEFARITMDGKVSEGAYGMSASEQNRKISSLKEFPGVVNTKFKEAPEKAKFTSIETGIRYPGERIKHVENKHGITGEDLEDIDLHMNALYEPAITAHKDKSGDLFGGQYQGTHVLARVHGNKGDYRIVLTFMPNGTVVFESAYKGTKEGIKKDIATHNSGVLPRNGVALPSGSSVAMSIPMIKEQLGIVNQSEYKKAEDDYNRYNQTKTDVQDYIVYHNVSEENLMKMAKLGGLPVPSIAVTRKGIPFNQFGGITLIGTKDLVDPEHGTDVWSRDAYTTRFPELVYDAPKEKDMNAFMQQNKKAFEEIGEENELNRIRSSILYTSDPRLAERELGPSRGMMYRYVTEKLGESVQIPMKDKENTVYPEIMDEDVKQSILSMKEPPQPGTPPYEELSRKVEKAMKASFEEKANSGFGKRWSEEQRKERAKLYRNRYLDEEGNVKLSIADRMYESMHEEAEKIMDTGALDTELHARIDNDKYMAWIRKELDTIFDAPKIQIGRKKVPLTLSNIVEAMTKKQGIGQEKGFTVSDNNVLAKGSQKFKTIKEMKEARDRIVTNEKGKEVYDEFVDALSAFREEGEKNFSGDLWDESDAANAALGDALKAGGTKAKLAVALRKQGFKGITTQSEMVAKGMAAIEAAKKVKTDYFEAKPARSVSFNEFKGAVVPKGTSEEAINFLKDQNMQIAKYDPDKPGDRQEKQEQIATQTGVYFQRAWHGSPYTFESFDLGKIGSGEGNQVHGWGLYFAKDKKVAESYKDVFGGTKGDEHQASIYEVEVPEDTVLLDEEKDFNEQPQKVKSAIQKLIKNLTDEELENAGEDVSWEGRPTAIKNVMEMLKDFDGKGIYNTLYDIFGGDKEASLKLNKYGVKGIAYGGREDGRCFVVFDDKAIQIIQRYNQTVTMGDIAKQKLAADQKDFAGYVDQFMKNEFNASMIPVMNTPLVMQLVGAENLPIEIAATDLAKILKKKHAGEIDPAILKQLPKALSDPLMIFNNRYSGKTGGDRKIIMVDLKDKNGATIVVPFELSVDNKQGKYQINQMLSTFGKSDKKTGVPRSNWFAEQLEAGRLVYVNKNKTAEWISSEKPEWPMPEEIINGFIFNSNVPNETDLVNLWNSHPAMYQGDEHIGAYDRDTNLIALFNGANQSTVIHETAHAWLTMLTRVAQNGNEKAGKDLETIRSWASFSEENIKEYAGTSLEKEFFGYAAKLRENPNDLATQDRYMQERFARGFERYLMTGSAPSKELRGVFRRFKKWLIGIYQDIKNLGKADPPEDIRRIFDSMLATQKEVDAWAAQRRLDATKLPIDYTKTEKENIDTWIENIKETVQERCLKNFMDQTKDEAMKSFDATIEEAKDQWRQELLQQHPVYQFEMTRQLHPTRKDWRNYLAENGMDEESYQKALQAAGGPLEEVIAEMAKDQRDQYIENVLTPDMIRETAEAMMQTPEGQSKKASMEAAMIKQRINKYIRTATLSLMELNRAEDPKTIALAIKERNGLLTDEDKHQLEKGRLEVRITASEAQVQKLRNQLTELVDGLKTARKGLDYPIRKMRQQAETVLADEKISKATNWKWWDNKARSASRRGAKALRKKDWAAVAMEKQNELHYATMARVAKEYEDNIKKELRGNPKAQTSALDKDGLEKYGILGIVNQIGRTDKPVRMSNQSRYFVQHMAFQLGLTNKDGVQPIDANGAPVEFSWSAMAMELNPTQAMSAQEDGNAYLGDDVIAPWLKSIFDGNNQTAYENLTYNQFHDIVTAMKAVYKIGRREYEGNTLRLHGEPTSFEQAAFALVRSPWTHKREDPFYAKNRKQALQRLASKLHHAVDTLTLPEILFERLGPDWYELFYQTIDRAAATKRQMTDEANQTLNTVLNMYNREEWRQMRSEKIYQMGHDEYGQPFMVTKEALLSAALNWGNRTNRDRLIETYRMREGEIEDVLFAFLTEKDWDFVEAVWNHIGSYWDGRNLVQNNTLGIPLGKVHGLTFTLPNGRKIEGAYYPIKYDPDTSVRAQERDANEIVKSQMQGVSTFALGMGSTKSRAMTSGDQRLRTDLEVYIEHVTESVQHISMREATVDVYKLITRKDVMDELVARVGMDQYNILKRWAADQWHSPMDKMGDMERFLNRMRGKMTFATMAYRVSTAVLNATNIFPMMDRMGAGNAIYAIGDMYGGNYMEKRNFILSKSSFMRERATNLDRDLMRERKLPVGQNTWKGISITQDLAEKSGKLGYTMITETDFMLSLPQWLATYKGAVHELTTKNENAKVKKTTEEIEAAAVLRADKAVRETFGSGEMKDQANLLKGKYIQQFLPFYSYTGLVLNQFIRAGYMIYDGKGAGQLMRSMLFWWILPVTLEAGLRYGMSAAAGDDKEDFWQRLGISLASGGPIGGIPFARDGIPYLAAKIMGAYGGDGKTDFYAATVFGDAIKIVEDLLSDKKDIIDVGRDVSRVSNRFLRVSDTLTDGFWTMLRCLYSDTDKSITEIIASILLDKQVKEKKGDKK